MAFVVEDGTGKSDSTSYISVEFADEYLDSRGLISQWSGNTGAKQGALIRATDYIDRRFGGKFAGNKKTDTQALEFPRVKIPGVTQDMPYRLLCATAEYAMRALTTDLMPDPSTTPSGYPIQSYRFKVDVIEESTTYDTSSLSKFNQVPVYPSTDYLLKPLLNLSLSGRSIRN